MEDIVKELVKLNQRDLLDIVAVLVPIFLSAIIIVQNKIYEHRNTELQKRIHNREWSQQYHDDILLVYNTYYEFCDVIFNSGFSYNIEIGYVNAVTAGVNQLQILRGNILRRKDLTRLLFQKKNPEMYDVIDTCFNREIDIIGKYIDYVSSGKLLEVSENAWNTVTSGTLLQKYNYGMLQQNNNAYNNFLKLCQSNELQEIKKLLDEDMKSHDYDNYDKYFEEYFAVDKLA